MSRGTTLDDTARHRGWVDGQTADYRARGVPWQRWSSQHTYNLSISRDSELPPLQMGDTARQLALGYGYNFSITPMLGGWDGEVEAGFVITIQCLESTLERLLDDLAHILRGVAWVHIHDVDEARYAYVNVAERRIG